MAQLTSARIQPMGSSFAAGTTSSFLQMQRSRGMSASLSVVFLFLYFIYNMLPAVHKVFTEKKLGVGRRSFFQVIGSICSVLHNLSTDGLHVASVNVPCIFQFSQLNLQLQVQSSFDKQWFTFMLFSRTVYQFSTIKFSISERYIHYINRDLEVLVLVTGRYKQVDLFTCGRWQEHLRE